MFSIITASLQVVSYVFPMRVFKCFERKALTSHDFVKVVAAGSSWAGPKTSSNHQRSRTSRPEVAFSVQGGGN